MKKVFKMMLAASLMVVMVSCVSTKAVTTTTSENNTTSIIEEDGPYASDVEFVRDVSEDGMQIIEIPYRTWYGTAKLDDKQGAITLAQAEAYAVVARSINSLIETKTSNNGVANNERLMKAIQMNWDQKAAALTKGCIPVGKLKIRYDDKTGIYEVDAKVGIKAIRFNQIINEEPTVPEDLTKDEVDKFLEINKAITEAARGNY
ncbi:MAG: hypothetical protein IKU01_09085 [Bacteroidales bacterium]|nr:hypothetical protein [Bacteroidales bacterium]